MHLDGAKMNKPLLGVHVGQCMWMGQFDQINNIVMEVVEVMEDNAFIMEASGHESCIISVWGQGGEGSQ